MWWKAQNLGNPQVDRAGQRWHFEVWHDFLEGELVQRIYFWNDRRNLTGVAEFRGHQALDAKKLKQRIRKLALDPAYRRKYYSQLRFPIKKYYS